MFGKIENICRKLGFVPIKEKTRPKQPKLQYLETITALCSNYNSCVLHSTDSAHGHPKTRERLPNLPDVPRTITTAKLYSFHVSKWAQAHNQQTMKTVVNEKLFFIKQLNNPQIFSPGSHGPHVLLMYLLHLENIFRKKLRK